MGRTAEVGLRMPGKEGTLKDLLVRDGCQWYVEGIIAPKVLYPASNPCLNHGLRKKESKSDLDPSPDAQDD